MAVRPLLLRRRCSHYTPFGAVLACYLHESTAPYIFFKEKKIKVPLWLCPSSSGERVRRMVAPVSLARKPTKSPSRPVQSIIKCGCSSFMGNVSQEIHTSYQKVMNGDVGACNDQRANGLVSGGMVQQQVLPECHEVRLHLHRWQGDQPKSTTRAIQIIRKCGCICFIGKETSDIHNT